MTRFRNFRDWPIQIKFGLIPLVAAIGFMIYTITSYTIASNNDTRLTTIESIYTPAIEVANSNNMRLERISDTLDSAVSIGDIDLANTTETIWQAFISDLNKLSIGNSAISQQSTSIKETCTQWYEAALPLSIKVIDNSTQARDPSFLKEIVPERQKMRSLLQQCRQKTWSFRENSIRNHSQAVNATKKEAEQGISTAITTGIATLIIILIIGAIVMKTVLKAIREINTSIKDMNLSDGLTGGLVKCTTNDEIGDLADNFNQFIGQLRSLLETTCKQRDQIQDKNNEIEALNEELRIQAITDKLTNLKNFGYFQEALDKRVREYNRANYKQPLSLIIVDIDHFKNFNDQYGHLSGNIALTEVSQRIRNIVRKMDTPCRYGGEEFVIILPNCNLEGAAGLAERLRRAIEMEPIHLEDKDINITASFGAALYQDDESTTHFIERADNALYEAKENGRNQVIIASEEVTQEN